MTSKDPLHSEIVLDEKTGLYHRPKAKELFIVKDKKKWHTFMSDYLSKNVSKGSRLLNIGAHIGIWSKIATEDLGLKVRAYEAIRSTAEVAKRNSPLARTICGAVGADDGYLFLYANDTSSTPTSRETRGRATIRVPCFSLRKILKEFRPNVITMDCEGDEYELVPALLESSPPETHVLDLEIHINRKDWRESGPTRLKKLLTKHGWKLQYIDRQRDHWAQGSLHSLWIKR